MVELRGDCLVVFPSDHRGEFVGDGEYWSQ
jgi:hypothetical protein